MVTVAYRRWSFYFTRGSNSKAFDWENFGVLDWRSLIEGGCLRKVVVHGGLTVQSICTMCRSIVWSLLYYCVRAKHHSCVLCDVT